jgi:hypothetical protein
MGHLEVLLPEDDVPPAPANRAVKLPPFWPADLRAWFTTAGGTVELWSITDELSLFFNCLQALSEATVVLITLSVMRVSSDPCQRRGCAEDRHHHVLRPLTKGCPSASGTPRASFQWHVDRTIRNCRAAFAWIDDIVVCSRTHEEHVGHVWKVLQALQDCTVSCLGHPRAGVPRPQTHALADHGCLTCTWCMLGMALSPTLVAVRATCSPRRIRLGPQKSW